MKCVALFPEPTPYRAPLLDRVARLDEIDLRVVYSARSVVGRTWSIELGHEAQFLRGVRLPGMRRVLRHDYPVTPGVWRILRRERPDVVVVSGWSTFASQAAIVWCRLHHVPYLVVVESHDHDRRSAWRRAVKSTVVPRLLRRSAGALVTGTLARASMLRAGVPPDRIWIFANTVDTLAFAARAAELQPRRDELRRTLGVGAEDVVVLSVSRLVPEKAIDVLLGAAAGIDQVVVVLAGDGPERAGLEQLGARTVFLGDVDWQRITEAYVAADVFALVSRHEPWGVVVNEAAACGLPLVLSEHVGAAADLLEPERNGFLVPVADVHATAAALGRLVADPRLRHRFGARSAEIAHSWGYKPSIESFQTAVRDAVVTPR